MTALSINALQRQISQLSAPPSKRLFVISQILGDTVTRPNQGLSTGRRKNLGTRLPLFVNSSTESNYVFVVTGYIGPSENAIGIRISSQGIFIYFIILPHSHKLKVELKR